jgi:hypothetical protein
MSNTNSLKITEYIESIDVEFKTTIELLRAIFLNADSEIAEHIKWNSLSFYYNGEMKEFDAKEYKRDLAVINLHRGKILIVFPTGNKIDKETGLSGKNYPDGRKIVEILNLEDTQEKTESLTKGIKNWLAQVDK